MTRSIENLTHRIEQLSAHRDLLLARQRQADRKRREREALEIGLWIIRNRPEFMPHLREMMKKGPNDRSSISPESHPSRAAES